MSVSLPSAQTLAPEMLEQAIISLNEAQKQAVKHIDGAMLILAGAGSGKTKTITTRLAYLIDEVGIPPSATLTLTFTNKAAQEMRARALALLHNTYESPPLLCTFHRFGLIFLRLHIAKLGRKANFVVLDADDKRALLKSLCKIRPISQLDYYISNMKNAFLSPKEAQAYAHSEEYKLMNRIYGEYEDYLLNKNLLDFDDLLYLTYAILLQDEDIAMQMSEQYQYIMVDEYQDTNEIQYKILKRLCFSHKNLCVVGDDDQSIYGWRGADVNNILRFPNEFDEVKVVKLEENYRSSEQILNAANALISHNSKRLGKNLKSMKGAGADVRVIENENESTEAAFLAKDIATLFSEGVSPSEIAVLFRVNALSRSVEEGFNRAKIPYKLVGAVRFYERAEIKDLLCYLRLIVNPNDDYSFLRIINRPRRGIGKVTQLKLEQLAQDLDISCLSSIIQYPQQSQEALGEKAYNALLELAQNIERWRGYTDLADVIEDMQEHIVFTFSRLDEVDRKGNIEEFYGMFRDYAIVNPSNQVEDFLNDIALASPTDEPIGECVSCMSIHMAKGLEFKYVYVIGFEEGFFPLWNDEDEIQEERRLGYVAITRAKDFLTLCSAKSRLHRGKREWLEQSRFLRESGLLGVYDSTLPLREKFQGVQEEVIFSKGMKVQHKLFGIGVIESVKGKGSQCQLTINFAGLRRAILAPFVQKVLE
ncbi:UvrD-helicase domain-containing protein [Helicobacter sp. MIT 21-1697]|uniref:ATP-dependent helicase n=1 Tax=Helicobacter sp. MIT 21-1697 TaxID=2993733 RepID=UPI00224B3318|nr:UvrD-helicase domain-containing protein [Helicobacter sp. MIT 21-1697]MCX2717859.1 UvrD-helicase domain-containing protein [Helicobacter sp. MIT 21-1697]